MITDFLVDGEHDPRLIRALSGLDTLIEFPQGKFPLGQFLLSGVRWDGEIDLRDRTTRTHFRRWRNWQARKTEKELQLAEHQATSSARPPMP